MTRPGLLHPSPSPVNGVVRFVADEGAARIRAARHGLFPVPPFLFELFNKNIPLRFYRLPVLFAPFISERRDLLGCSSLRPVHRIPTGITLTDVIAVIVFFRFNIFTRFNDSSRFERPLLFNFYHLIIYTGDS